MKSSSKSISRQIENSDADFIFAFGTIPIALLETNKPIYFITDATFEVAHNYHPYYSNVCKNSYKNAELLENIGFSKARKIFLSSEWAIQSALNHYKVPPSKIVHTYLGANIPNSPSLNDVKQFIDKRSKDSINLILIGKNWQGKGADRAIAINNELINRGYNSNLHIIGCKPPHDNIPPNVRVIQNLDKTIPAELDEFQKILSMSHFMLFPTHYDAFGHVVCEASAYGVPTIASRTGGVGDAVKEGVNGFSFDYNEPDSIQKSADIILQYFNNPSDYEQLCLSTYQRYTEELNWDTIVSKMLNVIKEDLNIVT
ncbi:MAG: glycosyltransferase family 4 protein [Chloroherpetonaceae bacterium]